MIIRSLSDKGQREYMEDRFKIDNVNGWMVLLVADGHGGQEVAAFLSENFSRIISDKTKLFRSFESVQAQCARQLYSLYMELDKIILSRFSPTVGSTLCTVFFNDDYIISANCGDTMAIVGKLKGGARWLSQEHKASSEIPAIESRGGRVYAPDGFMMRVNGTLNMSRSMGDGYLKQYITPCPYVTRCKRIDYDYIFVATDGVWDVLSLEDVHHIVSSRHDADDMLNEIFRQSRDRRSGDNIAMELVLFSTKKKPIIL